MNTIHADSGRSALLALVTFFLVSLFPIGAQAESPAITIANPDWFINMTDFGYSDIAADVEGGGNAPLYFREYLSGEWGAALYYNGAGMSEWLEPMFVFPDWTTNSTHASTTSMFISPGGPGEFPIYSSTVENTQFAVTQTYQFLDTVSGIEMGNHPASGTNPGNSITSNRYVLRHTYDITNKGPAVQDVHLFQFLHGLNSTRAVNDNRDYGETNMCGAAACKDYKFDTTLTGTVRAFVDTDQPFQGEGDPRATPVDSIYDVMADIIPGFDDSFFDTLFGLSPAEIQAAIDAAIDAALPPNTTFTFDIPLPILEGIARSEIYNVNQDTIGFHSDDAPVSWEVGRYGVEGVDSHAVGKPSSGVHISVESGTLSNLDLFDPGDHWVSGAQKYALGDLGPDQSVFFDVLLSISTDQTVSAVPVPATLPLLGSALAGLLALRRRIF